jgi:hypothetical protein
MIVISIVVSEARKGSLENEPFATDGPSSSMGWASDEEENDMVMSRNEYAPC